jgi:uncharacterized protein YbaR (Trm112 family)
MKIELLTILACPICKSELVLKDELILNQERGIPNLLPPNYK